MTRQELIEAIVLSFLSEDFSSTAGNIAKTVAGGVANKVGSSLTAKSNARSEYLGQKKKGLFTDASSRFKFDRKKG